MKRVIIPPQDEAHARLMAHLTISPADYAALVDSSMNPVYAALRSGSIPSVRLGQKIRIPSAWVRQQLHIPTPPEETP